MACNDAFPYSEPVNDLNGAAQVLKTINCIILESIYIRVLASITICVVSATDVLSWVVELSKMLA